MWISHPEYEGLIRENWHIQVPHITEKLTRVMEASKEFNVNTFGNIFKKKRNVKARLEGIYRTLDHVDSAQLCALENELLFEYGRILA
ncbi:hypothetical protein L6164_005563 [Bauhinia variegata]|uniref:Uncharacterized protein n=1 Tax=Bauhinia variegata TaxID=167791 RepID=A0ACB9PRP1_BAUVA|nr:hypothetical protein L6164_005563 [Bauhinia variegata]